MVHCIKHFAVHSLFELLEINHEARARIDFALHRDFEDVIVPVSIGVIALAKEAPVLLRRKLRIVVVVRGGEFSFAGEIEQGGFQFLPILGFNCNGLATEAFGIDSVQGREHRTI